VRVLALQSNPNVASALKGGQVDAGVQDVTNVHVLLDHGDAKLLGWVTDELGSLNAAVTFTTRAMADAHGDTVKKFLAALRQGSTAWHDAFIDPQGKRKNGPEAQKMIAILAEALHQPPAVIANGIGYFDPQNPIALKDLQNQIDWYREQGMIKGQIDAASVVDKRYAIFTGN
jgi:NitT/TauT family transport system substrate-binding protein